jgi:hypothetical protein
MQMQHAIIENNSHVIEHNPSGGAIGGVIARLFGCRHKQISRPFSSQGQTYRTCLDCGARRQFNLRRWEMQGDFYFREPTSTHLDRLAA